MFMGEGILMSLTVEYVKSGSAIYSSEDHTRIECVVKFAEFNEEVEFNYVPGDGEAHSEVIYEKIIAGDAGDIRPYTEWQESYLPTPANVKRDHRQGLIDRLKELEPNLTVTDEQLWDYDYISDKELRLAAEAIEAENRESAKLKVKS